MSCEMSRDQIVSHAIIQSTAMLVWSYHFLTSEYPLNMIEVFQSDLAVEMKLFYGVLPPIVYILTLLSIVDSVADIMTGEYHYLPKRILDSIQDCMSREYDEGQ